MVQRKRAFTLLAESPPFWSGRLDSNQRPHAPQACALPGCATSRHIFSMPGKVFFSKFTTELVASYFSFSLRDLSDLCVSAVKIRFKYTHRGDAENAEVAQS